MSTTNEPTFAQRAATLVETALKDDTVVVAYANSTGEMALQCRPQSAAALVAIARAVLDQAEEQCEREPHGKDYIRLVSAISTALVALPDPLADEDEDGDGDGT